MVRSFYQRAILMKRIRLITGMTAMLVGALLVAVTLDSRPNGAPREYVGQQTCVTSNCHESGSGGTSDYKGVAAFHQTMHQQIHLRPTPETVVIDRMFEADTVISTYVVQIRYPGRDTLNARLFKSPDKKDYYIQLFFSGGGDSTVPLKIVYTYGGRGWIERFLVQVGDRYYIPPFQYVLPRYRERSSYGGVFYWLDFTYWYAIDQATQEGRFLDFNSYDFKKVSWNNQCATCHINGMNLTKDITGTDTLYWLNFVGSTGTDSAIIDQNISIGCESCHGPGSEHVANPTIDNIVSPGRREQFPRTMQGTDLKLDLCNQCHDRFVSTGGTHKFAYDEANDRTFMPGEKLNLYRKDSITGMRRWPDAFTSYAHHQTGQDYRQSKPYLEHVFGDGCWSCHTVHYNKYDSSYGGTLPYQLNQNWYTMESGKGCLASGCHQQYAEVGYSPIVQDTVNLHTQHSQHASQCVNCHFTKGASIGFADLPNKRLYEFSNHNFKVYRPTITIDYINSGGLGMFNTCAESCHRNGRGSRNFSDTMDVAPDFGIYDANYGQWVNKADKDLADSLWYHYQRLYPWAIGGVRETNAVRATTRITSIAPNPFKSQTVIRFDVAHAGRLHVEIYNTAGARVRVLVAGDHQRGSYLQAWEGDDELGRSLPSGTYLIRITDAEGATSAQQVILAR